jgi:hypothetical protein
MSNLINQLLGSKEDKDNPKYDVINITFDSDIKTQLLDKLVILYNIKTSLFGNKITLNKFISNASIILGKSIAILNKYKCYDFSSIALDIQNKLSKIITEIEDYPNANVIPNLKNPSVKIDNGNLLFALDKTQKAPIKIRDSRGVTSVNLKPNKYTDIVKGLTNVTVSLEELGALADTNPSTPSVAYNNTFVDLLSLLVKASETVKGVVRFSTKEEIHNKAHIDSAVSPKDISAILGKHDFIEAPPTANLKPNTSYIYHNNAWVSYQQATQQPDATTTNYGITKLATAREMKDLQYSVMPNAVTIKNLNDYIDANYATAIPVEPYSQFYYGAVNPDEFFKLHGVRQSWIRIYNDPNEPPDATQYYYGLARLANKQNIDNGTPGAYILTCKSLDDYLNSVYGEFTQKITDNDDYIIHIDNQGKKSFEKYRDITPHASETIYGTTALSDGASTTANKNNEALTPFGLEALILKNINGTPISDAITPDTDPKGIWARTKTGFTKIAGTLQHASKTVYGTVKVESAAQDYKALMAYITNAQTGTANADKVVPNADLKIIEDEIKNTFKNMPNDGKTYLFTKNNNTTPPSIGYVPITLAGKSKFKTVFLDQNNEEVKTVYDQAIHIVNTTNNMQAIDAQKAKYTVNIAQVVGV